MKIIPAVPAARRIASERNIDLSAVKGTGDYGAVLTRDILACKAESVKLTPVAAAMADYYQIDTASISSGSGKIKKADILAQLNSMGGGAEDGSAAEFDEMPMNGMRNVIAENMLNSLSTQPQYTMCAELDTTEVFKFLAEAKKAFSAYAGTKLTFTDVMVKMTAVALRLHPKVNSSLVDGTIRRYNTAHVGIAVALDEGLIVPVVKYADRLSLSAINRLGHDLITKARENRLTKDQYSGSSFSISNLGNYPVDFSTPIINTPEGGILGISKTSKKPVVMDDEIVIRTMTGFSLTLDHRIIDGIEGAKFLKTLEELLANPMCVLVDL
ncbi:MAG: dihydrolipoamide acetyltransferase family protein [Spirochaetales bacterium]|uniref:Dihydrolipoamide acetyltransferase family protein n=1 Tax=Candidatus Thalassospirochaeta sargassi TaxID=3119039 RepID=A0AAJ1ID82_9SPIO|nr:dihydrolipoamide acetyltransferase family protein [Spirochaetales bacterium]